MNGGAIPGKNPQIKTARYYWRQETSRLPNIARDFWMIEAQTLALSAPSQRSSQRMMRGGANDKPTRELCMWSGA